MNPLKAIALCSRFKALIGRQSVELRMSRCLLSSRPDATRYVGVVAIDFYHIGAIEGESIVLKVLVDHVLVWPFRLSGCVGEMIVETD